VLVWSVVVIAVDVVVVIYAFWPAAARGRAAVPCRRLCRPAVS
jgi:hypothetical protein